jgi:hypothetical protein
VITRGVADRSAFSQGYATPIEAAARTAGDKSPAWEMAMDREPDPEEAVLLANRRRTDARPDDDERPILELSLRYSTTEIGEELGKPNAQSADCGRIRRGWSDAREE